jgi:GNAT superfamily N-acetyltransferase
VTPYAAPTSSLATISEGPNDPVPEALCARPPDQLSDVKVGGGKSLAADTLCGNSDAMTIAVVPLTDPDAAYDIMRAVSLHDRPDMPFVSRESYLVEVRRPHPGCATERFLGLLDGVPSGVVELRLPRLDNRDSAELELSVRPESRRRGLGRALHTYALDRVRELGRKRVIAEAGDQPAGGPAFATAMGAQAALSETRSRLDVTALDQGRLAGLLGAVRTHAAGYELVQWSGAPADDLIDDVAYLDSRFNTDAPIGDLELEPEKIDAARLRETEERAQARGRTQFSTGARHVAGGRLVAWTQISAAADAPWHAWQSITLVDPGHRGHRLGLLIKIENLMYACRRNPGLTAIDTFNARSNAHMLAINTTLGFRAVDTWTQWQQYV